MVIIIFFSYQSRDLQTKFKQCKVSKINSIGIKKKTSDKKKTGSESAEQLVPDFLQLESVTADIRCHSSPQRDLRHFSSSLFCTFHPILHFSSYKALFISSTGFAPLFIFCFFALFILFCIFHLLNEVCATFQLLLFVSCCFLLFPERTCTLNSCFYALFNRSLELFVTFFALFICI